MDEVTSSWLVSVAGIVVAVVAGAASTTPLAMVFDKDDHLSFIVIIVI